MADEWSPVFEHDGKGCPCTGAHVRVTYEYLDTQVRTYETIAGGANLGAWDWRNYMKPADGPGTYWGRVLRYQIRRPPSVQKMIDKAEGLPVKHRECV